MLCSRKDCYLASVALALSIFGCTGTDLPTASDAFSERSAADFFDQAPASGFGALQWIEPATQTIEVRREIGPAGGVIRLLRGGVEIHVPKGAVEETVMIEARALPGSVVAFEFDANGSIFGVPLELRIDRNRLAGSWSDQGGEEILEGGRYLRGLLGVYFVGDSTSEVTSLATFPMYLEDGHVVLELTHAPWRPGQGGFPDSPVLKGYAVASG